MTRWIIVALLQFALRVYFRRVEVAGMPAFNVAKTVTEPLAVASGCQTQPALKYSW
jgi:hypothetical protein